MLQLAAALAAGASEAFSIIATGVSAAMPPSSNCLRPSSFATPMQTTSVVPPSSPVQAAVVLSMCGDQRYAATGPLHQNTRTVAPASPAVIPLTNSTDPMLAQQLSGGLFATSAENAGVAALEAHHAFALARIACAGHQAVDKILRRRATAAAFADGNHHAHRRTFSTAGLTQVIDQHHIGGRASPVPP